MNIFRVVSVKGVFYLGEGIETTKDFFFEYVSVK